MKVEARALGAGELDHELLWLLVGAATLVLGALWIASQGAPPMLCPLKTITGLPCPTCGSTRALAALLAGEFGVALRWNPAVVAAAALAAGYIAYAAGVVLGLVPRLRVVVAASEARWLRGAAWAAAATLWLFLILDGR
jgi:hypothetical protein